MEWEMSVLNFLGKIIFLYILNGQPQLMMLVLMVTGCRVFSGNYHSSQLKCDNLYKLEHSTQFSKRSADQSYCQ